MIADLEELEEVDASELHARRLNAKEIFTPRKSDNFIFPITDGTVKTPWRRSTSETIHPNPGIVQNEEHEVFQGESDGLYSPNFLQDDSTRDDAEVGNDFWSITCDFIYRHHVEPRVKLYMPKEESFPIPLKYIDVTKTTHTSQDISLEKHIDDYENVDGERELSDASTGFTRFFLVHERPPDGYTWSGETDEETNDLNVWPEITRLMQRKAKRSKSGLSRNPNSIMPEDYVVSSSLNPMMKNSNTP